MKKIFLLAIFLMMTMAVLLGTYAFASEDNLSDDYSTDDAIYLSSYDDIMNMLQSDNATYESEYEALILSEQEAYANTTRDKVYRAKVISVEPTQDYYDTSSNSVNKLTYQHATVQILDGSHKGEEHEIDYILTADSFENINVKPIKSGETINVVIFDEDGETYVYATTLDASVVRAPAIIALLVITILLLILLLGKFGARILPQMILLLDLILLVFVPQVFAGTSAIWLAIVTAILYVTVESVIKLGIGSHAFIAAFSTFAVTVVVTLILLLFLETTAMSGISLEIANMAESYPLGKIDFYALGIAVFMVMLVVVVSNIACQTVRVFDENEEKEAAEKISKYASGMVPIIVGTVVALSIQKLLYLVISKYTFDELMNSEILMIDFIRGMFVVIGACVTPHVAKLMRKIF